MIGLSYFPFAEFAYNNTPHSSTGFSPFYANTGHHPHISPTDRIEQDVPAVDETIKWIKQIQEEVLATLQMAKDRDKEFYDPKRTKGEEPHEGDKVWLSHDHIPSNCPNQKLSHKRLGPFEVIRKIGNSAYELKLPKSMCIHPVFHTSRLALYKEDEIEGRRNIEPPALEVGKDK